MDREMLQYEFINSQTGNVIAYFSLPADMSEKDQLEQLEKKKAELAVSNQLYIELIYWQDHDHSIK